MEIARQSSGELVTLRLNGRLDANWCTHVQTALSDAVRGGAHHLQVDMAAVSYVSSAGLRVLLSCYKQLHAINGSFAVVLPSEPVRSVLELSGLQMLIASEVSPVATAADEGRMHRSASAQHQVFTLGRGGMKVEMIGQAAMLEEGTKSPPERVRRFGDTTVALGVGALGANFGEGASRAGEFLAVSGVAAFQPADGSSRPDFMVSEGSLVPEGHILLGLCGEGSFATLIRFEATEEARTVGMTELAQVALDMAAAPAVVVVGLAETAGLVGATLRRSPAPASDGGQRFGFPQIRDWLSFTSERAHRDSTSLVVGVIAKHGTALEPLLRPMGVTAGLCGHLHAAVFPYRPLRKGRIEMKRSVAELFDGHSLQAVLHLLSDPRGFNGAGESEFFRGALWIAPVTF